MGDLIIRPASSGNLKIQDQSGTERISLNTSGITTFAANVALSDTMTGGTIGSAVTFPTGVFIGMAFLADVTDGYGGASSESATLRTLNQNIFNINCPTTISSNEFSFDQSGTYIIYASAPAFRSERHILRLSDDSGSSFIGVGSAEFNVNSNSATTRSFLCKNVTISSAQITGGGSQRDFGFWHIVDSAKSTDGLGQGNNDTTTEQNLQVQIFRLA